MKYLIIVALVSVAFVLIYSRVRPYLKLIRKVVESLNVATEATATTAAPRSPSKNKLVRCESCGTWVPAERALHLGSGLESFCSTECLAKNSQGNSEAKERKLAG
ncbi:MAG TPA: hypothetical protein VGW58_00020 [Pyrinomonadaceae bacterium]|nr:hypothetical protein [Pyrinomonadaceae bacterium]